MPALVAGIHVFTFVRHQRRGWPGISAFTRVFRRAMPGHDATIDGLFYPVQAF